MNDITVTTNYVPRPVIEAYELNAAERAEFDYLDWPAIEDGRESASFFRYQGRLYDLGEFTYSLSRTPMSAIRGWDGYLSDSFFSGVLVNYVRDSEYVIVGRYVS